MTARTALVLGFCSRELEAQRRLLDALGVEVVGETTSVAEALDLIAATKPRVAVAAYKTLERAEEGFGFLRRARRLHQDVHCVVIGVPDEAAVIQTVFAAGASVCCAKTADEDDLAGAICQMFRDSVYYAGSPHRAGEQTAHMASPAEGSVALTAAEVEILQLVAEGCSNAEVAKMLSVTESTVKFHLGNIYGKIHVSNRTGASRWAQRHGLIVELGV